jgi:hypothetical protein
MSLSIFVIVLFFFPFDRNKTETKTTPAQPDLLEALSRIALLQSRQLSQSFLQERTFNISGPVKKVIYGNKEYGYFDSTDFTHDKNKLTLTFIPPGYQYKINFYAKFANGLTKRIGVEKFNLAIPSVFNRLKIVKKNNFSFPYLVISGVYIPPRQEHESNQRISFNLIINRFGEIVFIKVPGNGKKELRFSRYGIMKQIDKGLYAVLHGEKDSYFEIFNYKGEIKYSIQPSIMKPKTIIHHDFIYNKEEPQNILILANKYSSIRGFTSKTNFSEKVLQFIGKPFLYITSTVMKLDLKTSRFKKLFSFDEHFSPLKNIDLNYKKVLKDSQYKALLKGGSHEWGPNRKYQIDHTHVNSIKRIKPNGIHHFDGYILSLRNQHKIVFLDSSLKNVLWSVGHEDSDTYKLSSKNTFFYRQHDATITKAGNLALYDNHTSPPSSLLRPSRYLILSFNLESKQMEFVKHFVGPKNVYNATRGSGEITQDNSILVYSPNAVPIISTIIKEEKPKDYAYEIDQQSFKIRASMQFEYSTFLGGKAYFNYGAGSRAFPLYSIGLENFLGYKYEN